VDEATTRNLNRPARGRQAESPNRRRNRLAGDTGPGPPGAREAGSRVASQHSGPPAARPRTGAGGHHPRGRAVTTPEPAGWRPRREIAPSV